MSNSPSAERYFVTDFNSVGHMTWTLLKINYYLPLLIFAFFLTMLWARCKPTINIIHWFVDYCFEALSLALWLFPSWLFIVRNDHVRSWGGYTLLRHHLDWILLSTRVHSVVGGHALNITLLHLHLFHSKWDNNLQNELLAVLKKTWDVQLASLRVRPGSSICKLYGPWTEPCIR